MHLVFSQQLELIERIKQNFMEVKKLPDGLNANSAGVDTGSLPTTTPNKDKEEIEPNDYLIDKVESLNPEQFPNPSRTEGSSLPATIPNLKFMLESSDLFERPLLLFRREGFHFGFEFMDPDGNGFKLGY